MMPKVVIHEERRKQVASAVLAVAARRGLGNVTLREVAREAGCTTGTLSHYFRDKHELLVFAFRLAQERIWTMRQQHTFAQSPLEQLRASLADFLPIDDERRAICSIFLEYHARALSTADLAEVQRQAHISSCQRIAALLKSAIAANEVDPELDAEREAEILIAFVVGLAREALLYPEHYTSERQRALLDDVINRLARRPVYEAFERNGAGAATRHLQ